VFDFAEFLEGAGVRVGPVVRFLFERVLAFGKGVGVELD